MNINIMDLTNNYGHLFLDCFSNAGYVIENSVPVSSKVDPSVFFVGSTISVLKKFLWERPIPRKVLLQKAIRTQVLKKMEKNIPSDSCYGSYFIAMGTLAPIEALEETTILAITYLTKICSREKTLRLRVNSSDLDLLAVCQTASKCSSNIDIEMDSRPINYYRHHYGLDREGITGRNFNIAINSGNGLYLDVANIIIIENNGNPFAVEYAMGMSTFLTSLYGLSHTMMGNIIADILPMRNEKDYWLGDCVSVVSCLRNENVRLNSSHMQGRLFKRYLNVLNILCQDRDISLKEIISSYEEHEKKLELSL